MTGTAEVSPTRVANGERSSVLHSRLVRATWAIAVALLVGMGARQEHPSDFEHVVAGAVLAIALSTTVVKVGTGTWRGVAPWLVPVMFVAGAVATWNPLGLYAVHLIAGHPLVMGAAVAAITTKALCAPGTRYHRLRVAAALVAALLSAALLAVGVLVAVIALAVGRANFKSTASAGSTRIDVHHSSDCGGGTTAVVRTGSGLLLREGPSSPLCTYQRWELINDHVVVVTCGVGRSEVILGRTIDVDPTWLRVRAEATEGGCQG